MTLQGWVWVTMRCMTESTKNNDDESTVSTTNKSGKRVVHKLGLTFFRQKLVEHFDILFNNNQIQCPSRLEGS